MVIFRENTEDIYAGIEFQAGTKEAGELFEFLKAKVRHCIGFVLCCVGVCASRDRHSPLATPFESSQGVAKKIRFPGSSGFGIKPISREGTNRLVRASIKVRTTCARSARYRPVLTIGFGGGYETTTTTTTTTVRARPEAPERHDRAQGQHHEVHRGCLP